MLNHILATLNDYALAFNLNKGNYSFISLNINELSGYNADAFYKNNDLWNQLIDPRDSSKVKKAVPVYENECIDLTYRIATAAGKTKWIKEKRSIFTDNDTGDKILLNLVKDIQREEAERYDKEEALAEYSILFHNNPNPMWIYEAGNLRILKVNEAAVKTYGYTEDEFLTMTIKDIRPKSDHENLDSFLNKQINSGSSFKDFNQSGIWKHLNKNGEVIYADITSDSLHYKNNDCRIIIAKNVTESIYYQEELKLREQFLNSLIDSQTNFLIRIDRNGLYTFANKQFLKTFGYQNNEVIGRHFEFTTIPEETYLCENAFYNCVHNPGKVTHLVHKKPDKAGNLHDTEWEFIAIKDENGNVNGVQGIGQDITEKITAQKEIIWTKSSMEAIINNTEDLIWSVDRAYSYLYMNQPYKNIIKAHTGNIPKKGDSSLHSVYDLKTLEQWEKYYARAFNGERYIVTKENTDANTRELLCYETSFNPIYNADGEITGIGCFARNITERIKTSKAIIFQNERLRNIASLSSHELRRPVATMLGLINIIDRENFYNPDNKEIITHLLSVGSEIDDVIRLIVDNTFIDD
jgi:PAS domain S-box-containing protein